MFWVGLVPVLWKLNEEEVVYWRFRIFLCVYISAVPESRFHATIMYFFVI